MSSTCLAISLDELITWKPHIAKMAVKIETYFSTAYNTNYLSHDHADLLYLHLNQSINHCRMTLI